MPQHLVSVRPPAQKRSVLLAVSFVSARRHLSRKLASTACHRGHTRWSRRGDRGWREKRGYRSFLDPTSPHLRLSPHPLPLAVGRWVCAAQIQPDSVDDENRCSLYFPRCSTRRMDSLTRVRGDRAREPSLPLTHSAGPESQPPRKNTRKCISCEIRSKTMDNGMEFTRETPRADQCP